MKEAYSNLKILKTTEKNTDPKNHWLKNEVKSKVSAEVKMC